MKSALSNIQDATDLARRMWHLASRGVFRRKPRLFLRALATTLRSRFTSAHTHWLASIAITSQCNLNCTHCFSKQFAAVARAEGRPQLSTDEIIGLIHEFTALGAFAFDFQGGEVFLHPDLERILRACDPSRSFIGIITNGIMFDEQMAERLKKWGVDQIAVSVDSGLAAEHDEFRQKKGTWEKAINAVDIARRHGFRVLVNTTVTHQSLYTEGFKVLNQFCRERDIVHNIFIGIPVGNWSGQSDILIDEKDHAYLEQLAQQTKGLTRRDLYPRMYRSGCPAIKESVHVTEFGDVLPCPFTHISLGNVREHHLDDIVERGLEIKEFGEHSSICVVGQNRDFIARYGAKTFAAKHTPLDEEVFGFVRKLPPRRTPLAKA